MDESITPEPSEDLSDGDLNEVNGGLGSITYRVKGEV